MVVPRPTNIPQPEEDGPLAAPKVGVWREVWESQCWRVFPIMLMYIGSLIILSPVTPTLLTNFFASRGQKFQIHCEDFSVQESPEQCRDAHASVVIWQSWSSFVANSLICFLLAPLVGHWSDTIGRKPFLILAYLTACGPALVVLLHLTTGLSLYFYYFANALNGAFSSMAICLAFIADRISPDNRAAAFGMLMCSFSVAALIGPSLGGILKPLHSAYVCVGGIAFCTVCVILFIPETLTEAAKEAGRRKEMAVSEGKKPNYMLTHWRALKILGRSQLFIRLTLCVMISGVVAEGIFDLLIQYLQLKVGFNIQDQATFFVVWGWSGLFVQGLLLRFILKALGEVGVLIAGLTASMGQMVLLAFVPDKRSAFGICAIGALGGVSFPAISSIKANNVAEHEQGQIQGALYGARALAQGLGPFAFAAMFAAFSRSDSPLPYFPGAPFLLGAAMMCVGIAVAATIDLKAGPSVSVDALYSYGIPSSISPDLLLIRFRSGQRFRRYIPQRVLTLLDGSVTGCQAASLQNP
ncbi:hypothetical protein WJX84_009416 [Apatococcus fuscideae]|uniref:Major facilitator superfamily (MFS) profile domain-containing protein n=1 Tax=Apatococcus fuscideae TaxID=2026836 RepID=A0AAW1SR16_9CHLO